MKRKKKLAKTLCLLLLCFATYLLLQTRAADCANNEDRRTAEHKSAQEDAKRAQTASEEETPSYGKLKQVHKFRRKVAGVQKPSFAAPIGNVTAVLGRDARLVCEVDNLGDFQVSCGALCWREFGKRVGDCNKKLRLCFGAFCSRECSLIASSFARAKCLAGADFKLTTFCVSSLDALMQAKGRRERLCGCFARKQFAAQV